MAWPQELIHHIVAIKTVSWLYDQQGRRLASAVCCLRAYRIIWQWARMHFTINSGPSQSHSAEYNAGLYVLICALTRKKSVKWLILPMCASEQARVHVDFEVCCVVTII